MASRKKIGHKKKRPQQYGVECDGCNGAGVSRNGLAVCGTCHGRGYVIFKARR